MIALKKYRTSADRHTCPSCGVKKSFARYVDGAGNEIAENVGRCNRESKCGYHLTPRQYSATSGKDWTPKLPAKPMPEPKRELAEIPSAYFDQSQTDRAGNAFFNFLLSRYDYADVLRVCDAYGIGDFKGYTTFWRKDAAGSTWTAKLIKYDAITGKRIKNNYSMNWMHSILEKCGRRSVQSDYKRVLFGAHLMKNDGKPVAVVEAEKTAVIAALELPNFLWLACGGLLMLRKMTDDFRAFGNRRVILFPDAKAFSKWSEIAQAARARGFDVLVSDLLEKELTDAQKADDYDLADFLLMSPQPVEAQPVAPMATIEPTASVQMAPLTNPKLNHYAEIFAGNCRQCGDYLQADGSCTLCYRKLPF